MKRPSSAGPRCAAKSQEESQEPATLSHVVGRCFSKGNQQQKRSRPRKSLKNNNHMSIMCFSEKKTSSIELTSEPEREREREALNRNKINRGSSHWAFMVGPTQSPSPQERGWHAQLWICVSVMMMMMMVWWLEQKTWTHKDHGSALMTQPVGGALACAPWGGGLVARVLPPLFWVHCWHPGVDPPSSSSSCSSQSFWMAR